MTKYIILFTLLGFSISLFAQDDKKKWDVNNPVGIDNYKEMIVETKLVVH